MKRDAGRPRVLVAASEDAIELVRRLVGTEVELVVARTFEQACARLDSVELVVCNLRFHESRLFDLLRLLAERPRARRLPVVCCRNRQSWYGDRGIALALRELGVDAFVDMVRLERRSGMAAASRVLRTAVLSRVGQR